jgi:hypothetical protein
MGLDETPRWLSMSLLILGFMSIGVARIFDVRNRYIGNCIIECWIFRTLWNGSDTSEIGRRAPHPRLFEGWVL